MRQLPTLLAAVILTCATRTTIAQSVQVGRFQKVIISPYIQATFVQGDEESVTIDNITVDRSKLHVEVHGGTLRIYLDGARDFPHNTSQQFYPGHAVIATITYRKLDALSLRGDETFLCKSPLSAKKFALRIYGDSKVIFTAVHFSKMHTTIYGDGSLDIKAGAVDRQYYTAYGDGKFNTATVAGQEAKVTTFGEAEFRVNVSDMIRITAFGDARVCYLGNPAIVKGIHFGGIDLQKLD